MLAVACILDFHAAGAFAAETAPGDACSAGETNLIRQVGGPETTGIWHLMRCNGTTWQQDITALASGYVGIGDPSPAYKLSVADSANTSVAISAVNTKVGAGTSTGLVLSALSNYVNTQYYGSSSVWYTGNLGAQVT